MTTTSSSSPSNSIHITTDGTTPPAEIHIIYHSEVHECRTKPMPDPQTDTGSETETSPDTETRVEMSTSPEINSTYDDLPSQKPVIDNITITTQGPKPPAEIQVTVTCDITNTGGHTPKVFFPSQGEGRPMINSGGDTWTVSSTQMYGRGEKSLTIQCNGVTAVKKFKAG